MNNENQKTWLANKIKNFSKDPSTQVGAIIYPNLGSSPISFGYNGMPRGLNDKDKERNERPEKYFWYEHAERNAIYNLAREFLEGKIIFCSHFPNMESARAIVSCGIKTVVLDKSIIDVKNDNYKRVSMLFRETDTKIESYDLSVIPETFEEFSKLQKVSLNNTVARKNFSNLNKIKTYINLVTEYGKEFSQDPDIKSACIIFNEKTYAPIAMGLNGPPDIIKVTEQITPENKHLWYQEPEKNAIYEALLPKLKDSTFKVSWCPCARCALGIVSVGAKKVETEEPDFTQEAALRWKDEFEHTQKLFIQNNIELIFNKVE